MKKFFLPVLVIVSACSSCSGSDPISEDIIPHDQMTVLLAEIHLLEAKIQNLNIRSYDSAKVVYNHYEKLLFEDFNITQDQYKRSFTYYVDRTDEFKKVYDAVVDTLMQREKLEVN